jgi:hypothetical protein
MTPPRVLAILMPAVGQPASLVRWAKQPTTAVTSTRIGADVVPAR